MSNPPRTQNGDIDWETWLIEAPQEAMAAREKMLADQLREEYQADKEREAFWSRFYRSYPQLAANREAVEATMNKHMEELKDMGLDEAMPRLASLTRERIDRLERTRHERAERAAFVGGPDDPHGERSRVEMEEDVIAKPTLGDLIKQRRNERRTA